jgi:RimJ/RimL family protein N-acetyltransferase
MAEQPAAPAAAAALPIGEPVDPSPADRPRPTTLLGRHVLLRPLDPERDAAALWPATHGPGHEALWLYLPYGPFADGGALAAHLARCGAGADPLFFAVEERTSGLAAGVASYLRITPEHRTIEVGHILYSPALQRTPGATEAMFLLARHAFEDLGYRRYEWKCNALNAPSMRAAERLGFRYEGTFRQHLISKGRNRDSAWFSMLDAEWPDCRLAFERWLDPANFDAAGRQLRPLSALRRARTESD